MAGTSRLWIEWTELNFDECVNSGVSMKIFRTVFNWFGTKYKKLDPPIEKKYLTQSTPP